LILNRAICSNVQQIKHIQIYLIEQIACGHPTLLISHNHFLHSTVNLNFVPEKIVA